MNAQKAVELLHKLSIFDIAGTDGCLCMHCSFQGVRIDVSCHKSNGGVLGFAPEFHGVVLRVHSSSLDSTEDHLQRVADVVLAQIRDDVGATPVMVRLCSWDDDHALRCSYCHKPRQVLSSWWCDEHTAWSSRQPFGT